MRGALIVRAAAGLWFALSIGIGAPTWLRSVDLVGAYLRVDGLLGLLVAGLFAHEARRLDARREGVLAVVLAVDAAGRSLSGFAALVWPGLLEFPVTLAVFLGIMAACTAAVGLTEATLAIEEEVARHGRWHSRPQIAAGPVGVAAIASIGFGIAAIAFVGDPEVMRMLIIGHIVSVAAVMGGLAFSPRAAAGPYPRPSAGELP